MGIISRVDDGLENFYEHAPVIWNLHSELFLIYHIEFQCHFKIYSIILAFRL
jgi:hypothetical protein